MRGVGIALMVISGGIFALFLLIHGLNLAAAAFVRAGVAPDQAKLYTVLILLGIAFLIGAIMGVLGKRKS